MEEIKCPKCGEVFQVDESGYAAMLKQVRDKEFNKEIQARMEQLKETQKAEVSLAVSKTEKFVYMHNFLTTSQYIIDWYMEGSSDTTADTTLINNFRTAMINSN